jgi:hypothetical protein
VQHRKRRDFPPLFFRQNFLKYRAKPMKNGNNCIDIAMLLCHISRDKKLLNWGLG